MELEKQVELHEKKLNQHDKELSRLNDMTLEMQKSMNEGLTRVDESNRFLREQNTRQSEQNAEILRAVLERNEKSETHQHELKMLNSTNAWKLILGISAATGTVLAVVLEIIKAIGGR
ncbi:hypothetical protein ACFFIF_02005 [Vagococcus entomophilus]|uniref:Uncharacterized protein n=1 Tax=Vagococcus entomophilus TaxID=1160095 RepID=A0A430AK10_9ENTE|nr:hypothetical protein [Vagococcus entomophilus]RSU08425.1 hypothetical protein CBF30_04080 [Vagococcus entomophilus]